MARRIAFTGKQELRLEEFNPGKVEAGQVRLKGICSIISTGTENIVFNRLFAPGTHWDNWVKYPFFPGYSFIGEVVEVAADVKSLKVGQRVATRNGHATEHVVNADSCLPVPDGVASEDAAWFALGKITYVGARAAAYTFGSNVAIIGGGPIGQLSARWALAAGAAQVAMIDPMDARLKMAQAAGVQVCINKGLPDGLPDLEKAFGGKPQFVMDTTGAAPVFAEALNACAPRGKVILMGDCGTPGEQRLTPALLMGGLQIVAAHDGHASDEEAMKAFWPLLQTGRFKVTDLVTHRFALEQAAEAYQIANTRRGETMGMVFNLA